MSALLARVDLAITAGGSTCYELARCGIPGIVTSIADSQATVARALNEHGAMISIDGPESNRVTNQRETRLGTAIRQLINNPDLRRKMSERGMQLVDGYGADRIVSQMSAMVFPLREAVGDDVDTTWHWRNDPEVRSVSFNEQVISLADHQTWLQQKLNDPATTMWVSEDLSGRAVGQVCFDFSNQGQSALISIIVDQARRGRGLGTILIASASQKLFEQTSTDEIIAQVKPGNVASEKAFRAAGFKPIEPAIVNGKIAHQFVLERTSSNATSWPAIRKSA